MAVKIIRNPSETPNINNTDDFRVIRYAVKNQNGYIPSLMNCDYVIDGLNFTIKSGRLIVQGVDVDIDADGATVTADEVADIRYYTVYLELRTASKTAIVKCISGNDDYPDVPIGASDTLQFGFVSFDFPLYHFKVEDGQIKDVDKLVKPISYEQVVIEKYGADQFFRLFGRIEEICEHSLLEPRLEVAIQFKNINLSIPATMFQISRDGNVTYYPEFAMSSRVNNMKLLFRLSSVYGSSTYENIYLTSQTNRETLVLFKNPSNDVKVNVNIISPKSQIILQAPNTVAGTQIYCPLEGTELNSLYVEYFEIRYIAPTEDR